ncbi:hypothetical protein GNI_131150 [Gregarina niphandrodes]|uniref:Transmembrane protein n=1 Tax=Gregarina niphandrodes TaxID=110365 RepID=A0A023B1S2_GRENI|nr:hypothetical protein GNI_131150 [Gregarina niphandrodes]EZG47487.1 hypothetical protein GNI_131150 [Gregarina niphandrodes]|eukprot:XP_011132173.1 hypothetical protein GNI_131150 [Gregarina niphandrodes]
MVRVVLFLLSVLSWAGLYEPSRLLYGHVSPGTGSLEEWYLRSLLSAGVSEVLLPGYVGKSMLTGPIASWQNDFSDSQRSTLRQFARQKKNRLYMIVDASVTLDARAGTDACSLAQALKLDGVLFALGSNTAGVRDALTSCAQFVDWTGTITPSQVSSPAVATGAADYERHIVAFSLSDFASNRSLADAMPGVPESLLVAGTICEGQVCPAELLKLPLNDNGIYLGNIPSPADANLEQFLTTTLPDINGLLDDDDRKATPASPESGGAICKPRH